MGFILGLTPEEVPLKEFTVQFWGERHVYIGTGVANSVSQNRLVEISTSGLSGLIAIIY